MRVGLMKIKKEKNVTLHNFVQCSCKKFNKNTQVQKLSNLLQKCTYVQSSINYSHKTATGAVLFTGLPPFNLKSVSQYSIPHGR